MTTLKENINGTIPPGSCQIRYSLRKKVLLKLGIVALVALFLLYFIPSYYISEELIKNENSITFASISQGMNIIDHETRSLEEIVEGLAFSSDTYMFISSGGALQQDDYIKKTLSDDALNIIHLDMLCFLTKNGEIFFYEDAEKSQLLHNQSLNQLQSLIQINPRQFISEETPKTRSGFLDLGDDIMMVASTPIYRELNTEPAGYLIGGRFLTEKYEKYFSSVMEADVQIIPYHEAAPYLKKGEPLPAPPSVSIIGKVYLDDKTITAYRQLTPILDDKGVILIITALRPNVQEILEVKDNIVITIGIIFIVFIVIVLLTLNRDFFKRMKQLSHNLAEIQNPQEIDPDTLIIPGRDEISEFSHVLSDLVSRLIIAHQNLLTAKKEAEAANRAKSIFLANMSHEIRTPLNAIIGFSALMASMVTQPQQKRYVDSINASSKGLLSLINDILDLSKIDAEKLEISRLPTDIHILADELQMMFQQQMQQKGLLFTLSVPESAPQLMLDEARIKQILLNLIGNALKFTNQGHISLVITVQDAGSTMCNLMISVHDSGIGIPLHDQERIFQAFEQQDPEVMQQYGGTGLGLTISKRLAERMGGTITVESKPGEGSIFTLLLYHVEIADIGLFNSTRLDDMAINVRFHDASVLVVDDVENNRIVLADLLQHMGLTPVVASCGDEALRLLSYSHPSLILTDLRMPGMSGDQLLKEIKKRNELSGIPIVAVTALSSGGNTVDMSNFDSVLNKPIIPKELIHILLLYLPVLQEKIDDTDATEKQSYTKHGLLPDVAEDAQAIFGERINRLNGAFSQKKAAMLADEILKFAQEHNSQDLERVAVDISEAAGSFDMKRIKEIARFFSELISNPIQN